MTIGIVGVKRGMTRIFYRRRRVIPVTVIEATPNRVVQRKTADSDGYECDTGDIRFDERHRRSTRRKPDISAKQT